MRFLTIVALVVIICLGVTCEEAEKDQSKGGKESAKEVIAEKDTTNESQDIDTTEAAKKPAKEESK